MPRAKTKARQRARKRAAVGRLFALLPAEVLARIAGFVTGVDRDRDWTWGKEEEFDPGEEDVHFETKTPETVELLLVCKTFALAARPAVYQCMHCPPPAVLDTEFFKSVVAPFVRRLVFDFESAPPTEPFAAAVEFPNLASLVVVGFEDSTPSEFAASNDESGSENSSSSSPSPSSSSPSPSPSQTALSFVLNLISDCASSLIALHVEHVYLPIEFFLDIAPRAARLRRLVMINVFDGQWEYEDVTGNELDFDVSKLETAVVALLENKTELRIVKLLENLQHNPYAPDPHALISSVYGQVFESLAKYSVKLQKLELWSRHYYLEISETSEPFRLMSRNCVDLLSLRWEGAPVLDNYVAEFCDERDDRPLDLTVTVYETPIETCRALVSHRGPILGARIYCSVIDWQETPDEFKELEVQLRRRVQKDCADYRDFDAESDAPQGDFEVESVAFLSMRPLL